MPLSRDGLARLHAAMSARVAAGELPGLVLLVAVGDDVHVEAIGAPSFTADTRLRRDAIFRMASLTKPVVAAAALALVDEGRLRLEDPIDDLVPELAARRVLRALDAELDDTVPARRAITIADLLDFRLGFGAVMATPGTYPIQVAEAELELRSIGGPPWPPGPHDPDSWIAALGTLPLIYQPGEVWLYNTGTQVLGILLARACGQDLGEVLRERIFEPLDMDDTGFWVPPDRLDRLTTFYLPDGETGELSLLDEPPGSWWASPPRHPDASGWLVSTVDDYWAFVSMLLAGGRGVLAPATVARMTGDRLTPAQREPYGMFFGDHGSWGLGLMVPAAGAADPPFPAGVGWDGGSGVTWRSQLDRGATGILLTQRHALSPAPSPLVQDFWAGVNAATRG
jgi:CubicO group peptidase (beta-lactamase class C family)